MNLWKRMKKVEERVKELDANFQREKNLHIDLARQLDALTNYLKVCIVPVKPRTQNQWEVISKKEALRRTKAQNQTGAQRATYLTQMQQSPTGYNITTELFNPYARFSNPYFRF